jgi:hypothetical protein
MLPSASSGRSRRQLSSMRVLLKLLLLLGWQRQQVDVDESPLNPMKL